MSRAEGFAAIPNWMIRDKEVSRRAVLVYASLASRSGLGGIFPSQSTIADEAGVSERTARTALAELVELGAIDRVRRTDEKGHRLPDGYVLQPNGLPATLAARASLPAIPTGNQPQPTPLIEVEPIRQGVGFAEFYMAYPRKVGKEAARRAFEKAARSTDPQLIVDGARRYASDPNLPEKRFIPHPASWLNAGRWDDEPEVPRDGVVRESDFAEGDEWMAFNR